MNHINDAVRYMSETQTNIHRSEFKSRTTELERRVYDLERQLKLLLELNNGSINLEGLIREEVLKVLSNR